VKDEQEKIGISLTHLVSDDRYKQNAMFYAV
jgi:hypothetical protein